MVQGMADVTADASSKEVRVLEYVLILVELLQQAQLLVQQCPCVLIDEPPALFSVE